MDKVNELLCQAWSEAKAQGVVLEAVHFNCEYFSSYGEIKVVLNGIDIDAKMKGENYDPK